MSSSIADPQASLFEAKKELPMLPETMAEPDRYLQVSFGYKCNVKRESSFAAPDGYEMPYGLEQDNTSFSCLSGAALSANATLANTNICNGLIGAEILPTLDSPKSFRRVSSSPSFARLDFLSSSLSSGMSTQTSPSSQSDSSDCDFDIMKSMSAPSRCDSFLNIMEVEVAGGAAGEDRVQAFCSEENGWVFCSIYDGFNGRDAADYLAGTLYKTIAFYLSLLDKELKQGINNTSDGSLPIFLDGSNSVSEKKALTRIYDNTDNRGNKEDPPMDNQEVSYDSFKQRVLESLEYALSLAENDFLCMVEQEMEDRPDLVSIGSCALVVLLYGRDLFTLNLGDSRAVLARYSGNDTDETEVLEAIQLTEIHTVDNEHEREQLVSNHPNDPTTIVGGRVKGKLKLTRAFGVGYLKKRKMNDALMGILQVRNLLSPPYISTQPSLNVHRISKDDCFVIIGSDGLFDFFNNDEAVKLVHAYILSNPSGDPAKFLLEQLLLRAADNAGISTEELMRIPAGRRRKYHDDVTVIVIILGSNLRTSKASTFL